MNHSIRSQFADSRLSRIASELSAMIQPAIQVKALPCRDEELPLGSTRIGGRPDLFDHFVWPVWNDKPLAFLAQVNLADLVQFPFAHMLPQEGWLLFFYDAEQSTWGFDPQDQGSWAVIFEPQAPARLARHGIPSEILQDGFYTLCRVEMKEIATIPPWDSNAIEKLFLSKEEQDAYLEMLEEFYPENEIYHQLLGHSQPIQSDMQLECQLVSNRLYCGDLTGYKDPRANQLADGVEAWRLLFQIDSDDNSGMMWGDGGRLYFWMHEESLHNRDFGKSWMVLQCY